MTVEQAPAESLEAPASDWFKSAVVYQIYPRSFADDAELVLGNYPSGGGAAGAASAAMLPRPARYVSGHGS